MKLPAARIAGFLKAPDAACRGVLCYGPDAGLVRERAERLVLAAVGDLKDPFRIAELTGAGLNDDAARLADELAAMSLTGGRRAVRLREAGDGAAGLIAAALKSVKGDTLLVVEAGDLPPRSALRKLFESASELAAIPCYADAGRDLAEVIRETLGAHRVGVDGEAMAYLTQSLGGDRLLTRAELEKLALYVGDGGRVGIEDALACVGDTSLLSLDDVVFAVADGDARKLEAALPRALQEGAQPVSLVRAAMRHFQRLNLAGARLAQGDDPDTALRALRPPVFFKHQDRMKAQLRLWPLPRSAAALAALTKAEIDMKDATLPQETLARACFADLMQMAKPQTRQRAK
jgi:DNA polymerase-3 subunit delta